MAKKEREFNEEVAAELTAAEQAKLDKIKKDRQGWKEARDRIRKAIPSLEDGEFKNDLISVIGLGRQAGLPRASSRRSINIDIRDLLLDGEEHAEMEIFKAFHIGRPEMAGKIRMFIRNPNFDERLWIHFDEEKEVYQLKGKGKEAPEGWTGFMPAENIIL